jgi:hypothetical protein
MSAPDPRGQLEHMTAADVGLGDLPFIPPPVDANFLRHVVKSTTSYSEGWREVAARLLWVEAMLARPARPVTDAERRAWKLVEALAEDCEYLPDGDHEWQKCRRCLAVAELSAPETRLLMRELLALRNART